MKKIFTLLLFTLSLALKSQTCTLNPCPAFTNTDNKNIFLAVRSNSSVAITGTIPVTMSATNLAQHTDLFGGSGNTTAVNYLDYIFTANQTANTALGGALTRWDNMFTGASKAFVQGTVTALASGTQAVSGTVAVTSSTLGTISNNTTRMVGNVANSIVSATVITSATSSGLEGAITDWFANNLTTYVLHLGYAVKVDVSDEYSCLILFRQ